MAHYIVRRADETEPVPCPCGWSRRLVTRHDTRVASLHLTHITDSEKHYHKRCTEYYYVVEGGGRIELDGDVVELRPGTAIVIPPGVAHRGRGDFKALIVAVPALEEDDELTCS